MIKPARLREALTQAWPVLQHDPDKLLVFIDQGHLVATAAPTLSFEYHYQLNLVLTDYAGSADEIMVALLSWIKRHQPELLAPRDPHESRLCFEVDPLNHTTCDLSITLPLTERVIVTPDDTGSHRIEHADEPIPEGTQT